MGNSFRFVSAKTVLSTRAKRGFLIFGLTGIQ
jgi:hypothetical protein